MSHRGDDRGPLLECCRIAISGSASCANTGSGAFRATSLISILLLHLDGTLSCCLVKPCLELASVERRRSFSAAADDPNVSQWMTSASQKTSTIQKIKHIMPSSLPPVTRNCIMLAATGSSMRIAPIMLFFNRVLIFFCTAVSLLAGSSVTGSVLLFLEIAADTVRRPWSSITGFKR